MNLPYLDKDIEELKNNENEISESYFEISDEESDKNEDSHTNLDLNSKVS